MSPGAENGMRAEALGRVAWDSSFWISCRGMQGLPSSATSLLSSEKMTWTAGPPGQGPTLNATLTRLSCHTEKKV